MKLEDIIESLDFNTNIDWNNSIGTFIVNDYKFIVQVRPATSHEEETFIPFFDNIPKVGNVDFSMITENGKLTQDTTNLIGMTAMKVFSVVAQAVMEQINQHDYQILLCVAKKTSSPTNYDNRVRAYETITDRAARKSGMLSIQLISRPTETIYLIYHPNLQQNVISIKQHLDDYYTNNR